MTEALIIENIEALHADVREIKNSISDLCQKTAVLDTEYKNHVANKVKEETKKWKALSILTTIITTIVSTIMMVKYGIH